MHRAGEVEEGGRPANLHVAFPNLRPGGLGPHGDDDVRGGGLKGRRLRRLRRHARRLHLLDVLGPLCGRGRGRGQLRMRTRGQEPERHDQAGRQQDRARSAGRPQSAPLGRARLQRRGVRRSLAELHTGGDVGASQGPSWVGLARVGRSGRRPGGRRGAHRRRGCPARHRVLDRLRGLRHRRKQRLHELVGVGMPVLLLARERLLQEGLHCRGHRRALAPRADGRHRLGQRGGQRLAHGVGAVGRAAGEAEVEHRPQRVEVGALVHRLAARLLGRHVLRRAQHLAGGGELLLLLLLQRLHQPEVEDLDELAARPPAAP